MNQFKDQFRLYAPNESRHFYSRYETDRQAYLYFINIMKTDRKKLLQQQRKQGKNNSNSNNNNSKDDNNINNNNNNDINNDDSIKDADSSSINTAILKGDGGKENNNNNNNNKGSIREILKYKYHGDVELFAKENDIRLSRHSIYPNLVHLSLRVRNSYSYIHILQIILSW